ncbi:2Fe-2S iron-sulfur cluster binding domain-containing protein [Halovenus sp. WSH3]|uniref:2Fe-2S iron-sulfur cluster binding domain-containing protein n=1 Tax=Halovenus carboxidivorans TaxID=2692199 RepID=A0A6B0T253_9EURY|nr:2Fe-2S iron-sulfur cluster-binding protein [Halovenus carboxidivorans]MXR50316.1 2Fe-2S iron-sulfur cluster binding domain-containing protein [Halovenus carboxidivorans]
MPTVSVDGREIECERGANLRDVLSAAGVSVYNGGATYLNCRGLGSCGTCAVEIDGEVTEPTAIERARLSIPPHDPESGLRLACQTTVEGDLTVRKHEGFWGHHTEE